MIDEAGSPPEADPDRRLDRRLDRWAVLLLGAVAYIPIILTDIGRVSADTKTYLTLDPGTVVRTAPSMWDPSVGAGTVPHQNIGYLFPLGPYYWLMEQLGSPDWLTQRLLWGTLVFAAAYGTYRLTRWLGWTPAAAFVAAFAYGMSPYLLSYLARLSVILGPWAAMPWMILLAAVAARTRSWRPAAWFAVVVALVGSVNATSLVFAGLGPVLWLLADVVSGRVRPGSAIRAAAKIGLLTALVSAWWIAGLRVQGAYGLPILRYTESYQAVASSSTPPEVLRGLGYWFFYGGDGLEAWVGPSGPYIGNAFLITLGFVLVGIALLGLLVPFAGRAAAALLLFVGLVICVGAAPLGHSTLYGTIYERFATDTTVGLALRSTTRAAPLVVLAMAMGLGAASERGRTWVVEWSRRRTSDPRDRSPSLGFVVPALVVGLLALQLFPWFTGTVLTPSLLRDETLPSYETDLAAWLDATGDGRVYEIPGSDFANYRWGGTVDPVLPGLIDRPYLARELVPQGGNGTADLLNAFERRLADGWFEPESLAPVARLFGAETIVTRNDLQHERYRLARPGPLWTDVTSALGAPDYAGPLVSDQPSIPLVDSLTLSRPDEARSFPAVAAFELGPAPPVRAASAAAPTIVAGSGDGLVDLAGAGLLDAVVSAGRPTLYAATLDHLARSGERTPEQIDEMVGSDPWWVVTDTNKRQGRHWSTISSNLGALETGEPVSIDADPSDNRLPLFDDVVADQTIAVHEGDVADVRASYFGNSIAYTPEDAPWFAIDGDPTTAWRAGVFAPTHGLVWEADLAEPARTDSITLLQPITGEVGRFITRVAVTVDDTRFEVDLDERSRTEPGQPIALPVDSFSSIRIEVLADNVGRLIGYAGQPGVGFAEVTIPGVVDDRVVQVPNLSDNAAYHGHAGASDRLSYVFTRERIDPATPNRTAPEPAMARRFDVPEARPFALTGEVRLSAAASDVTIQQALGETTTAVADRRLHGVVGARGASARDGDPATAWTTPLVDVVGAALTFDAPTPGSQQRVGVTWLDDDEHSSPTVFSLRGDDGTVRTLSVADATLQSGDGTQTATFDLDGFDSSSAVLTIEAIDERTAPDYYSKVPLVLPVALVDVAFENDTVVTGPSAIDSGCRDDLVLLDGAPLPVRITGTRDDALGRRELSLAACTPELELAAGPHRIDALDGRLSGFDIDRLVLDSPSTATAGGAETGDQLGDQGAGSPGPTVAVDHQHSTSLSVTVGASAAPSWLVLEQSWNPGWTATIDGTDLGPPTLIDGYANGWIVPAGGDGRTVELRWTPQDSVRLGLAISAAGAVAVLAILAVTWRRRRTAFAPRGDAARGPLWARRAVAPAIVLAGSFAVVGGVGAAIAALATAFLIRRWRWLPAAVVLVLGGLVGAAIVGIQWYRDYPPALFWPARFAWAAPPVWIVVAVVIAAAVFPDGIARRTRSETAGSP